MELGAVNVNFWVAGPEENENEKPAVADRRIVSPVTAGDTVTEMPWPAWRPTFENDAEGAVTVSPSNDAHVMLGVTVVVGSTTSLLAEAGATAVVRAMITPAAAPTAAMILFRARIR